MTNTPRRRHGSRRVLFLAAVAVVVTATVPGAAAAARSSTTTAAQHRSGPRPTVVLVHGAWADSSSWDGVVRRLQHDGYPVRVFPTPLRSLSGDSAALRVYLTAITGPVVVVGHSYGGAVVTDAATGDASVKALVYVDAFAPAAGETVSSLLASLPGPPSVLQNPDPTQVFTFVPSTLPPTPGTDLYVRPDRFPRWFANDLPRREGAVLAATQRPVTLGALNEPSTAPAWASIPSWYEIGTIDKVIPAAKQRAMARRAGSHITERRTSHLPMVSHPVAVTRTIESAADATR